MRIVIVGLGNQGKKRLAVASDDCVATVDPAHDGFADISEVPSTGYSVAFVCTPDEPKQQIVEYLLSNGKHVLVEKPFFPTPTIVNLAQDNNLVCYTAYNHRFEPHIRQMADVINKGILGKLYLCKMSYGFGTAADVKGTWRDQSMGVLSEVGTHLIDLAIYWFGIKAALDIEAQAAIQESRYENAAPDHFFFAVDSKPDLMMEASWISWKNTFTVDLYGEKGSAHIDGLLKWGPSSFTLRTRVLPSGRPTEETCVLTEPDNTLAVEYNYFKTLCYRRPDHYSLMRDIHMAKILKELTDG